MTITIPSSYTADTLGRFMHSILGNDEVGKALNWDPELDYEEAVIEAAYAYGTDDISSVSGMASVRKLRAIARVEVWRSVMERTAGDYDLKIEGESFSRSQFHDHAQAMLDRSLKMAAAAGVVAYQSPGAQRMATGSASAKIDYPQGYYRGSDS